VPHTAQCITTGTGQRYDPETETILPVFVGALCKDTYSGGMGGRPESAAAGHIIPAAACIGWDNDLNASAESIGSLLRGGAGGRHEGVAYGLPGNWIGRKPENGGNAVEPMHDVSPCLTKMDKHAVAFSFDPLASNSMKSKNPHSGCREVKISNCLDTTRPDPAKNQGGMAIIQDAIAFAQNSRDELREMPIAGCLAAEPGMKQQTYLRQNMAVRRLTPTECERLQGFPDGHTAIPWRNKPAGECPDGPRYKAIGNSWAVPCFRWIAQRINLINSLQN
jgi:DNA (cytosine-5)-methyltransferase 1